MAAIENPRGPASLIEAVETGRRPAAMRRLRTIVLVMAVIPLGLAMTLAIAGSIGRSSRGGAMAIALGPIGFALVALLRAGTKGTADGGAHRRAANPGAPWAQRTDWAAGRLSSGAGRRAMIAWAFAIFWSALSLPALFAVPHAIAGKGMTQLWPLIFPAAGVALLWWAARRTLQWRIYGESHFIMPSVPGQIGGSLEGTLQIDRPPPAGQSVSLRLTCVSRETSGDSTSDRIVWNDDQRVINDGSGAIPIAFYIPAECQPTDNSNPRARIIWRLYASAPGAGLPYDARFEVPVFKVNETASQVAEAAEVRARRDTLIQTAQLPAATTFRIAPSAEGGTEVYFPALRNPGPALVVAAFLAGWTLIMAILLHAHAPAIFPIVWALFDGILSIWAVSLWLGTTRVLVGAGRIKVCKGLLGVQLFVTELAAGEINRISAAAGMTMGNIAYNRTQIRYGGDKTLSFGDGIRSRIEA